AQAITAYQEFVSGYPGDAAWNKARMELSLAKIRQAVEAGGNFEPALKIAQTELEALENDKNFDQLPEARPELAELLPQIARGLAVQAGQADDPAEAKRLAEQTVAALDLCRNAKFVSKDLRDDAALEEVETELARVSRRQATRGELGKTVEAMKTAIAAGDARGAYAAHEQLLAVHPELAADATLQATILEASAAERSAIKFVADEHAAETAECPTPWLAVLTTGNRESITPAPTTGTFVARVDGAIYAFNVADGRLLWRRYAGFAAGLPPLSVGSRVLVFDAKHQELQSLDELTGKLVWRQEIGEPIAAPLTVGNKAFLAAASGKLYVLDLASGNRLGYLQFAQPLRVAPIVDRRGKQLILAGDHSSIYTISLADLKTTGVFYSGHSSGSITVPPAQVLDRLAVFENDGVATSRLRMFALDADGAVSGQVTERRLQGLAASPPLVDSRRLIVVTDRGELDAFDVSSGEGAETLTPVATREPTSREPLVRYPLMTQGAIWVGDTQLTKYAVLPTGNRLPVQSLENSFVRSTFDHPLSLFGSVLVSVRRVDDQAGATVTAIDEASGRVFWNNQLAVPPAATPLVDDANRAVAMADVNGLVYRFDEAALRARVQDQPLAPISRSSGPLKLTTGVDLGSGRGAFAAPRVSQAVLLYDPTNASRPVRSMNLPSVVACPLSPFGTGFLAPLEIGQVLWLDPSAPQTPPVTFQPRLEPGKKVLYQSAGEVGSDGRQFVITDGFDSIYLVELASDPSPHFTIVKQQKIGAFPIVSGVVVLDQTAFAAIDGGQLLRFALPALENQGQTDLPGDLVWGPYRIGEQLLLATARDQLVAVAKDGAIAWNAPITSGDLAGPPLELNGEVLLAYKKGTLERRSLSDGQVAESLDVEQPLATGPVRFLDRIVVATHDGSLLVLQQP
ncbi:MAG: PQQ-binding-like beta-propeller repeat protein, partial [Pirellulales bacterium]